MNERQDGSLLEFYGQECAPCIRMMPIVERLERDTGIKLKKLEVWHDQENKRVMGRYWNQLASACGGVLGVPAFYNEKTGEALCGEQSYDRLKSWALRN